MNTRCLIFLSALTLLSCKDINPKSPVLASEPPVEKKLVKINGEYGVLLPDYMTQNAGMNAAASLQYASIFKKQYIVVIDESRDTLIMRMQAGGLWRKDEPMEQQLAKLQLSNPGAGFTVSGEAQRPATIGGLPAVTAEASAQVKGLVQPFHYYFSFVDGTPAGKVYTVMAWCYEKDTAICGAPLRAMTRSFRLLHANADTSADHG